jgi:carbonic anhydrase
MEEEGLLGACDVVSCAGAAKVLAEKEPTAKRFLMSQIAAARELHGIREVIIVHHADCGAYKKDWAFESQEHELGVHADQTEKAAEEIRHVHQNLAVRRVFATLDKSGSIKFIDL